MASTEDYKSLPVSEKEAQVAEKRPIFEDKSVALWDDHMEIKDYYFPIATAKHIHYNHINYIKTAKELDLGTLDFKTWGMGLSNIWWALHGFSDDNLDHFLVIETGSSIRKGFVSANAPQVVKLIKQKMAQSQKLEAAKN